jgi:hypothetical protein
MVRWERGFVVAADLSLNALRAIGKLPPGLVHARVADWGGGSSLGDGALRFLAGWPELARLRGLELLSARQTTSRGLSALAASPHVGSLRRLWLHAAPLDDGGVRALASMDGLEAIALEECNLTSPRVRTLTGGALRLSTLSLYGNPLGLDGTAELAAWPGLAGVRALDLGRTELGPAGVRSLLGAQLGARWLMLDEDALGTEGARLVAGAPQLGGLEILDLSDNNLDVDAVRTLVDSPHLPRALRLYLDPPACGLQERVIELDTIPVDTLWEGEPYPWLTARFHVERTDNNRRWAEIRSPRPMRDFRKVCP